MEFIEGLFFGSNVLLYFLNIPWALDNSLTFLGPISLKFLNESEVDDLGNPL